MVGWSKVDRSGEIKMYLGDKIDMTVLLDMKYEGEEMSIRTPRVSGRRQ